MWTILFVAGQTFLWAKQKWVCLLLGPTTNGGHPVEFPEKPHNNDTILPSKKDTPIHCFSHRHWASKDVSYLRPKSRCSIPLSTMFVVDSGNSITLLGFGSAQHRRLATLTRSVERQLESIVLGRWLLLPCIFEWHGMAMSALR